MKKTRDNGLSLFFEGTYGWEEMRDVTKIIILKNGKKKLLKTTKIKLKRISLYFSANTDPRQRVINTNSDYIQPSCSHIASSVIFSICNIKMK